MRLIILFWAVAYVKANGGDVKELAQLFFIVYALFFDFAHVILKLKGK